MSSDDGRVEKRGGGPGNDDHNEGHAEALHRFRSAASIAMSPELFEKLYLSPENRVHGDLRRTFGNPTPMCVLSRCGNLHALLKRLAWARSFPCLTRDQLTLACEQWPRRLPPLPHAPIHGPHGLARRRRQRRREHVRLPPFLHSPSLSLIVQTSLIAGNFSYPPEASTSSRAASS